METPAPSARATYRPRSQCSTAARSCRACVDCRVATGRNGCEGSDSARPTAPLRGIVVDIVNSPDPTALCLAARARGCRTQSGRPMHEGQAVHALRFLGFDYLPEGKSVSDIRLPH